MQRTNLLLLEEDGTTKHSSLLLSLWLSNATLIWWPGCRLGIVLSRVLDCKIRVLAKRDKMQIQLVHRSTNRDKHSKRYLHMCVCVSNDDLVRSTAIKYIGSRSPPDQSRAEKKIICSTMATTLHTSAAIANDRWSCVQLSSKLILPTLETSEVKLVTVGILISNGVVAAK